MNDKSSLYDLIALFLVAQNQLPTATFRQALPGLVQSYASNLNGFQLGDEDIDAIKLASVDFLTDKVISTARLLSNLEKIEGTTFDKMVHAFKTLNSIAPNGSDFEAAIQRTNKILS